MLRCCRLALLPTLLILVSGDAVAEPVWKSLIPFRRVEADPSKWYAVDDQNGPWMILASTFAGEDAQQQAHELVLELRKRYKLEAYLHRQSYDFTKPLPGKGINSELRPLKARHKQNVRFDEIAVLVGNFPSVEDGRVEKTLKKVRRAHPSSLDLKKGKGTTRRFAGLRDLQRRFHPNEKKRAMGPMAKAFVTRNPRIPANQRLPGLDPLVVSMNKGAEFSLLKNRAKYTIKVATFRGRSTMNLKEIDRLSKGGKFQSKLEHAAEKANTLAKALRKSGYEAYEFHDRYESIVTVGSFASIGTQTPAGLRPHPEVQQVIQSLGGTQRKLAGFAGPTFVSRTIAGVPLDLQPVPIEVPRASIASAYARKRY